MLSSHRLKMSRFLLLNQYASNKLRAVRDSQFKETIAIQIITKKTLRKNTLTNLTGPLRRYPESRCWEEEKERCRMRKKRAKVMGPILKIKVIISKAKSRYPRVSTRSLSRTRWP